MEASMLLLLPPLRALLLPPAGASSLRLLRRLEKDESSLELLLLLPLSLSDPALEKRFGLSSPPPSNFLLPRVLAASLVTSTFTLLPWCWKFSNTEITFSVWEASTLKKEKLFFTSTRFTSSRPNSIVSLMKSLRLIQSKPSFTPTLMKNRVLSPESSDSPPEEATFRSWDFL